MKLDGETEDTLYTPVEDKDPPGFPNPDGLVGGCGAVVGSLTGPGKLLGMRLRSLKADLLRKKSEMVSAK